jgi:hypothetical protein
MRVLLTVFVGGALALSSPARSSESEACTADATKALVRSFVSGYAAGRVRAIDRMVAPAPRFRWFSAGKPQARLGAPSHVRSTLVRYFRARVREHERIRIVQLGAGYDPRRRIVNFGGELIRSADDIRPPRGPTAFKGAVDCVAGRPAFIVWSM